MEIDKRFSEDFVYKLEAFLENEYSSDFYQKGRGTPSFNLALYLARCIIAFEELTQSRDIKLGYGRWEKKKESEMEICLKELPEYIVYKLDVYRLRVRIIYTQYVENKRYKLYYSKKNDDECNQIFEVESIDLKCAGNRMKEILEDNKNQITIIKA
jgi:hypothetical protein